MQRVIDYVMKLLAFKNMNMKAVIILLTLILAGNTYAQTSFQPYRLGIVVKDADRASEWYEKNLGFKSYKKMSFPEYDSLKIDFLRSADFEIELVQKKTSLSIHKLHPGYNMNKEPLEGFAKIAFRTKDIKAWYEKLKKNGVKEVMGITYDKTFNADFFMIEDIDGNLLQFIQTRD
jgi:uncharacterized glyoxalase superfamily protein PhnB